MSIHTSPGHPDVTKPASALAAPSTGFSRHAAAGATTRAAESYQNSNPMEDVQCHGCDQSSADVGPLARYRVRDLEGNVFVARYCAECAHVASTAVAFPGCGYGAVALPDTFVACERLADDAILNEQHASESRVLREYDLGIRSRLNDGGAAHMVFDGTDDDQGDDR